MTKEQMNYLLELYQDTERLKKYTNFQNSNKFLEDNEYIMYNPNDPLGIPILTDKGIEAAEKFLEAEKKDKQAVQFNESILKRIKGIEDQISISNADNEKALKEESRLRKRDFLLSSFIGSASLIISIINLLLRLFYS